MRYRGWAMIGIATVVACGGKIAPVNDFGDDTLGGGSDGSRGSSGTGGGGGGKVPKPTPTFVYPDPTGHPTSSPPPPRVDGGAPSPPIDAWVRQDFAAPETSNRCKGGAKFIRYSPRFDLWVGVELCKATRYKIFLALDSYDSFFEVADYAGSGQDHCELVNPSFTIPNEDDIKSGCAACDLGPSKGAAGSDFVFTRAFIGEPFDLGTWSQNAYTAAWYECGVAIP